MPTDLSIPLKHAIILHLSAFAPVTSLVPAERIYGMQPPAQPVFPFIRYGSPVTIGYEATCWSGSEVRVTLHAFADGSPQTSGEDEAGEIARAIVEAMKVFSSPDLAVIHNEWLSTQILPDAPEADRWHAVVEFSITAIERKGA